MRQGGLAAAWLAALLPPATAQDGAAPNGWTIYRDSGDPIRGEVAGFAPDSGHLRVRTAGAETPIRMAVGELREARRTPMPPAVRCASVWLIELTNGDRLASESLAMDAERVHIANPRFGELALPRAAVRRMIRPEKAAFGYAGPTPGDEWLTPTGARVLDDIRLVASAGEAIGRQIPGTPGRVSVEFTIHHDGTGLYVSIFNRDMPLAIETGRGGYALRNIGGTQWQLMRFGPNGAIHALGFNPLDRGLTQMQPPFRMRILADLDESRFVLFHNEHKLMEWKDLPPLRDPGDWLTFISPGAPTLLTDIRVTEWKGEDAPTLAGEARTTFAVPDESDEVVLSNGDRLKGEVAAVDSEGVQLRSASAPFAIRADRVREIGLRKVAPESAAAAGPRIVLKDQSAVTLGIERLADGVVTGKHGALGAVRLPMEDVARLVWRTLPPPPIPDLSPPRPTRLAPDRRGEERSAP